MDRVIKFLKFFFTLVAAGILLAILFILHAVREIPTGALNKAAFLAREAKVMKMVPFEEGSLVSKSEFRSFHLFSRDDRPFGDYLKKNESIKVYADNSSQFLFEKNIEKAPLHLNNCLELYCFGIKMPFEKISSVFWKGLIGVEDSRFLDHFGIDPKSILRAIVTDIKSLKLAQGGSTITQQLVKNLFYTNKKSFYRKLKEMVVAIYIELRYEKKDILEAYFNQVHWGSLQGVRIKGLYAASLFYFAKKPRNIAAFEAAILISMLKGPSFFHPLRHIDRLKQRANIIYQKLVTLNLFSGDKEDIWGKKDWDDWLRQLRLNEKRAHYKSLWRVSSEKDDFLDDYREFVFYEKAKQVLKAIKLKNKGVGDFSVKAIIKNITRNVENTKKDFTYYSKYERKEDRALYEEKHQIGSTLKPLLYSLYFDYGATKEDMVKTSPLTMKLKSGDWSPREAHQVIGDEILLETALQHSYNRPVVYLAMQYGFERLEDDLKKILPELKSPLSEYPAQLLGAIELSVGKMIEVYTQFIHKECKRDEENNIISILSDPSKTTIRKLVNKSLRNISFFGKTGTSNLGKNNWFVFFDGKSLGVILVSVENVIKDKDKDKDKEWGLYGGTTAFKIFQQYMTERGMQIPELMCFNFSSAVDE